MTPQRLTQRCHYKRGANVNVNAKYSIILRPCEQHSKESKFFEAKDICKQLKIQKHYYTVFLKVGLEKFSIKTFILDFFKQRKSNNFILQNFKNMARRNFFLFKNVYLLSRGKKAAGPLADLEGGKAAKLIAGWILPRMMRLAFSRAGHDTTLPRQRDHVIRPQCCWLLRCCVVVNAKLKILACGALVFSITNKKQHSFCSNSMVNFFLTLATTSFPSSFL